MGGAWVMSGDGEADLEAMDVAAMVRLLDEQLQSTIDQRRQLESEVEQSVAEHRNASAVQEPIRGRSERAQEVDLRPAPAPGLPSTSQSIPFPKITRAVSWTQVLPAAAARREDAVEDDRGLSRPPSSPRAAAGMRIPAKLAKPATPVAGEVQEFLSEKGLQRALSAVQEKAKPSSEPLHKAGAAGLTSSAGAAGRSRSLEKKISFLPERKKTTKHVPMVPPPKTLKRQFIRTPKRYTGPSEAYPLF